MASSPGTSRCGAASFPRQSPPGLNGCAFSRSRKPLCAPTAKIKLSKRETFSSPPTLRPCVRIGRSKELLRPDSLGAKPPTAASEEQKTLRAPPRGNAPLAPALARVPRRRVGPARPPLQAFSAPAPPNRRVLVGALNPPGQKKTHSRPQSRRQSLDVHRGASHVRAAEPHLRAKCSPTS